MIIIAYVLKLYKRNTIKLCLFSLKAELHFLMLHLLNRAAFILQKLSSCLVFTMFTKLCQNPCFYFYIALNYSVSTNPF